jgi:excisionase family DNA binding protein
MSNATAPDPSRGPPAGLWTLSELASFLRVSEKTLRRRVADGTIPVVQIGPRRHSVRVDPLVVLDALGVGVLGAEPRERT